MVRLIILTLWVSAQVMELLQRAMEEALDVRQCSAVIAHVFDKSAAFDRVEAAALLAGLGAVGARGAVVAIGGHGMPAPLACLRDSSTRFNCRLAVNGPVGWVRGSGLFYWKEKFDIRVNEKGLISFAAGEARARAVWNAAKVLRPLSELSRCVKRGYGEGMPRLKRMVREEAGQGTVCDTWLERCAARGWESGHPGVTAAAAVYQAIRIAERPQMPASPARLYLGSRTRSQNACEPARAACREANALYTNGTI